MNLRDYHPKITALRLLPPYRLPWWEQKINYYVVPCYVWPTYFHDLIHPNLCKCRKIQLHWLDIWGYSFKFIPNKRLTVEGLWKIMCEGENESGSLWLTLTLAVTMLFLFLLWPWVSAQTTLVCGILLHVMGVSRKGDYICLSVVSVALDGQGQPSLSFPRPA